MHTLRMSNDDLRWLGTGGGRLDDRALRDGQLSRRLLAIHQILDTTERKLPAIFAEGGFGAARATFVAAQRADRRSVNNVICRPQIGAWIATWLSQLQSASDFAADDDLGYWGGIAAVSAFRAGISFDVRVRCRTDGTVMLPTLGLARPGASAEWLRAQWTPSAESIELSWDEGCFDVVLTAASGDKWWPIRHLRSDVGERSIDLELDDVDPFRDRRGLGAADRLSDNEVRRWQNALDVGWEHLYRVAPRHAETVAVGIVSVVPLAATQEAAELSATVREAIGATALTEPRNGAAFAEALVHEHRHSLLWALLDLVPLTEGDTEERHFAPWRSDPRPARGLLHGIYAYSGLVDLWQAELSSGVGRDGWLAHFEFALWHRCVRVAIDELAVSGCLTPAGRVFLEGVRARLDEQPADLVPEPVQDLADLAALDLRLLWQVRNVRPAERSVSAACNAWAGGEVNVVRPDTSTVEQAQRRFVQSPRVRLARIKIGDPPRFAALRSGTERVRLVDGATDADLMLLDGDIEGALTALRSDILVGRADPEQWAGLALAAKRSNLAAADELVTSPEWVAAVHSCVRACTGRAPDPVALADWLQARRNRRHPR